MQRYLIHARSVSRLSHYLVTKTDIRNKKSALVAINLGLQLGRTDLIFSEQEK